MSVTYNGYTDRDRMQLSTDTSWQASDSAKRYVKRVPAKLQNGRTPSMSSSSDGALIGLPLIDQAQKTSSSEAIKPLTPDMRFAIRSKKEELAHIASLPPVERWKYLARKRTSQFVLFVMALLAWLYAVASAYSSEISRAVENISIQALAQVAQAPSSSIIAASAPSINLSDAFLVGLGVFILWSLGTITFAKAAEKVGVASDCAKILLGVLVGFFSNTKVS